MYPGLHGSKVQSSLPAAITTWEKHELPEFSSDGANPLIESIPSIVYGDALP